MLLPSHPALWPHARVCSGATNVGKQQDRHKLHCQRVLSLCPLLKSTISLLLFQNSGYPRREPAKTFPFLILIKSKSPFLRALQAKQRSITEKNENTIVSSSGSPGRVFLPFCSNCRLFLVCRCKNTKF